MSRRHAAAASLALFDGAAVVEPERLVAGVDEAGRGPLAGPVAVAAVVFDPSRPRINGLDDSKQLTAARREQLHDRIIERALAWHVVLVDADTIDRLNIYQATLQGMRDVVAAVAHVAGFARIDGNVVPKGLVLPAQALVGVMASTVRSWPPRSWPRSRATATCRTCTPATPSMGSSSTRAMAPRLTWPRCASTAPARSTAAASPRYGSAWKRRSRWLPTSRLPESSERPLQHVWRRVP